MWYTGRWNFRKTCHHGGLESKNREGSQAWEKRKRGGGERTEEETMVREEGGDKGGGRRTRRGREN